jgi:hypothetical protein
MGFGGRQATFLLSEATHVVGQCATPAETSMNVRLAAPAGRTGSMARVGECGWRDSIVETPRRPAAV